MAATLFLFRVSLRSVLQNILQRSLLLKFYHSYGFYLFSFQVLPRLSSHPRLNAFLI
jgi:hypothetical protein